MIDQALYQRALAVADQPVEERDLINAALRAFIARQAQFRLAGMGEPLPISPMFLAVARTNQRELTAACPTA
ncbi:hypothetical protein [Roseateles chitinivorans]|uniref:hypothetical protein n=1 Tax=Roseateles chitinivorans TaxID=2917965 RepID=UPI003D67D23A